jgi:hypothetical protein
VVVAVFAAVAAWVGLCVSSAGPAHSEAASPQIGACPVLPADNVWNAPVDTLPLDPNSAAYVSTIGATHYVHADFSSGTWQGGPIGIPYVAVPDTQPGVRVSFDYDGESDHALYPIPPDAPIEGGPSSEGDHPPFCTLHSQFPISPFPPIGL